MGHTQTALSCFDVPSVGYGSLLAFHHKENMVKDPQIRTCPKCGTDFADALHMLGGKELSFCLNCQFPLVLVAGKYRLEEVLGEGGYGIVYKARHIYLEHDALRVVKLLKPDVFNVAGMEQRFYREVQVTSSLSEKDEHIVRIYDDFGKLANMGPFYVMEYLEGTRLDQVLEEAGRLPSLPFILHVFRQLLPTIQFAHESGIVHRDLKPDNLFLVQRRDERQFLKVLDFGIAKPLNQEEMNMTQGVLGTPFYMAPEQCLNETIDVRTDIYAMGCILFELLTGFPPFHKEHGTARNATLVEMLSAHITRPAPSAMALRPDRVSKDLDRVLLRSLEKHKDDRFQSAKAMLLALESAVQKHPFTVPERDFAPHVGTNPRMVARPTPTAGYGSLPSGEEELLPVSDGDMDSYIAPMPSQDQLPAATPVDGVDQADNTMAATWVPQLPKSGELVARTGQYTIEHPEGVRYYKWMLLGLVCVLAIGVGSWFAWQGRGSAITTGALVDAGTSQQNVPVRALPERRVVHVPDGSGPAAIPDTRPRRPVVRTKRPLARVKRRRKRRVVRRKHIRRTPAIRRQSPRRSPPERRVVVRPRPVVRVLPPPVAGCPAAKVGRKWVRVRVHPAGLPASVEMLGRGATQTRTRDGMCLSLSQATRIRVVAPDYRPCSFVLPFRNTTFKVKMKKDTMDDIETDPKYCIR